jgi:hypothetical protein
VAGLVALVVLASAALAPLAAQQVLDRVVAWVGPTPIMMTDLTAARALGVVDSAPGGGGDAEALGLLIERQLALVELTRFPGPEPDQFLVDDEVARMKGVAGPGLPAILESTGVDERRLRDLARNTVRIRAYLENKFPLPPVSDADARRYYTSRPEEFTRNGVVLPFEEAQPAARAAVAEATRQSRIARWLDTLRGRVEVVVLRK